MEKIMFLIDSPCDLTKEDCAGKPIRVNSAVVMYDGKTERDYDIDRPAYYEYLKRSKEVPNTAMAPPTEWLANMTEAYENGYTHIIGMTVSTTGSSVLQTAKLAREMFEAEHPGALTFTLLDSRAYTLLYGNPMLEALEMNERGAGYEAIVAHLKARLRTISAIFCVYSLACMKKSGRISGMSAFVGEALGIRPILYARDGVIAPIDKIRGEKNLLPKVAEHIVSRIVNPGEQTLTIIYGSVPAEDIDRLEVLLREKTGCKDVNRHTLGCSVSTNCGPETIAVVFHGEPYDTEIWEVH